jgi:hypothetical protein
VILNQKKGTKKMPKRRKGFQLYKRSTHQVFLNLNSLLDPIVREKKEKNQSKEKNTIETELMTILKKTVKKNFDNFVQILDDHGLESLEQWKLLTENEKNEDAYPRGLRKILDEAAQGNSQRRENEKNKKKKVKWRRHNQLHLFHPNRKEID